MQKWSDISRHYFNVLDDEATFKIWKTFDFSLSLGKSKEKL